MKYYVQYDENGRVHSQVHAAEAPDHPRQIAFDEPQEITGKMIVGGEIVDDPNYDPEA